MVWFLRVHEPRQLGLGPGVDVVTHAVGFREASPARATAPPSAPLRLDSLLDGSLRQVRVPPGEQGEHTDGWPSGPSHPFQDSVREVRVGQGVSFRFLGLIGAESHASSRPPEQKLGAHWMGPVACVLRSIPVRLESTVLAAGHAIPSATEQQHHQVLQQMPRAAVCRTPLVLGGCWKPA